MIRAEQVRQGTGLWSPRIANWGYEPDFYGGDLYTHQIPAGGCWMPHIAGATAVWTPNAFINQPGVGAKLFWDLISLFYNVKAPKDVPINVEHFYEAREATGTASYRFDELPQRVVEKILPANYDLSRIAGVVGLGGGTGNDFVEINARDEAGTDVAVKKQVLDPYTALYPQEITDPVEISRLFG